MWGGLAAVAALVATIAASRALRSDGRNLRREQIAALVAEAEASERAGRLDRALTRLEIALRQAEAGTDGVEPFEALRRKRDELALAEARTRLRAVEARPPQEALGECLTLLRRAETDPALARLIEPIEHRLADLAAADLAAARRALAGGRPDAALAPCERTWHAAAHLPREAGGSAGDAARDLLAGAVAEVGLIIEPIQGQYWLGSPAWYDAHLLPMVVEALRRTRYLPRPAVSPFRGLWDEHAPYRLAIELTETPGPTYLESANRKSQIDLRLILHRTGATAPLWQVRSIGRTRHPLPGLTVHEATRYAICARPDASIERRLFEDAQIVLRDQLAKKLHILPPAALSFAVAREVVP
ncbi:MAG: hypothetical protein IRY99_04065 [Isosphaeraceae bacterium]|nr:hypothetical protein [Isosphaeraceae bacterium]